MDLDFGFHLGDTKTGVKHVSIFFIAMFLYIFITSVIAFLNNKSFQHNFPLNYTNVLGTLGFQLFLSGTSEEVLFRALPITLMIQFAELSKRIKIGKIDISIANIVTAVFFALAHISLTVNPFSLNYNLGQLLFSFALGITYGIVYEKSKSVLYPMIMHSMTNVTVVGIRYLMFYLETVVRS
jgi:membrane protease YdiL (CAAX protease family)